MAILCSYPTPIVTPPTTPLFRNVKTGEAGPGDGSAALATMLVPAAVNPGAARLSGVTVWSIE